MTRTALLWSLALAALYVVPPPALSAERCESIASLVSAKGQTQFKKAQSQVWETAQLEHEFCSGDAIRTGPKSTAAVRMVNETIVRLAASTTLTFTQIAVRERSLIDLLKGALHFISRVPRSLKVNTPYVNASVEGTEFVVTVDGDSTVVSVFNGTVLAANDVGQLSLTSNETAIARSGRAPVRQIVARPRDAVNWALYLPPLPPDGDAAGVRAARQGIFAIARNDLAQAQTLIDQAVATDPPTAAALIARSYLQQARFDIPATLEDARAASELAPRDAIVRARLAEVLLMTGDTRSATAEANRAVAIDPGLAHTQTVLGFASLRQLNLDLATRAFRRAIELDSTAPLPRLGLGLTKIRSGDLKGGREDLETAALLNPNNALLRSYLGKAYYEERRNTLAHEELTTAKNLDLNDPTAWFYHSILLQSENRPVEALRSQQQAITLNNRRGVYRSRQLLDQDSAARSVALGRIYDDLGLEQLAITEATAALALDPGNHSAHRLMADSYYGRVNLDAARQSELLQSKLSQPLNLDPLQPQLNDSNLGLLDGTGPGNISYNEYNPLFTRNGWALQLDGAVAEQDTWSEDVVLAGLHDRLGFSLGQFHTETGGFRPNADYEQDIYNAFAQVAVSERLSLQFELNHEEEDKGDVAKRLRPDLLNDPSLRVANDTTSYRAGLSLEIAPSTKLVTSIIQRDNDVEQVVQGPGPAVALMSERDLDMYDVQLQHSRAGHSMLFGLSYNGEHNDSLTTLAPCPPPPVCQFPNDFDDNQGRIYGYYFFEPFSALRVTGGATIARDDSELFDSEDTRVLPKLGARWSVTPDTEIRLAAFRSIASSTTASLYQTLEPTQVAGFNQVFDEFRQTLSWNYGAAVERQITPELEVGINAVYRDSETPLSLTDARALPPVTSTRTVDSSDKQADLWLSWLPHPSVGLSAGYSYHDYETAENIDIQGASGFAPDGVVALETHHVPIALSYYHPSGWSARLNLSYYDQQGQFQSNAFGARPQDGEDSFWLTDLVASYRLPNRRGMLSVGIKNLLDESFRFEDRNSYDTLDFQATATPSKLSDERLVFGQVSINFR